MSEQPGRVEITIRCVRCRGGLARMTPTPGPARWRVDRLDRVPWVRGPLTLGVDGLGDLRAGLAGPTGELATRALPVPQDGAEVPLHCRRCGLPGPGQLDALRARADRAERRGERMVLFP